MNNNRQQNGRRRGRGGQRQGGGNPGNGSRIDNRARGNAAQLLEKYKSLAADAQRQGDRVNTEYYLQFADHYFRVVSEQRGRQDEQQQARRQASDFDYDGDEDYGDEGEPIRAGEQSMEGDERQHQPTRPDGNQRRDRGNWNERAERQPRRGRDERADGGAPRGAQREEEVGGQHRADPVAPGESLPARAEAVLEADAPLAPPRRARAARRDAAADTLDIDRLPPSFVPANDGGTDVNDAAEKPRRRRLRPAAEGSQAG